MTAVTVIVEEADAFAFCGAGELAVMVKSCPKLNVAVVEWTAVPLVPVIVTGKLELVAEVQVRLAVAGDGGSVTLVGLKALHVSPLGTVSVRPTDPAKPFTPVIVMVEVRLAPAAPDALVAAIVKSVTVNIAVALWDSVPLVPVTIRL